VGVLFKATVTDFGEAEYALDDTKGMFDLGPDFGFDAVTGALRLVDDALVTVTPVRKVSRPRRMRTNRLALTLIGLGRQ